jgi:hypothetical protein
MSWYTLNLFAILSLVVSEIIPHCSWLQANGILHGAFLGVSTGFGVIHFCVQKDPQKETLTQQPGLQQGEEKSYSPQPVCR